MSDLHYESLLSVSEAIRTRRLTSAEVTKALLDRIEVANEASRSYATVTAEHAMRMAKRADDETARGMNRGPLHGVPIAVKDLCDTTFAPTAAGTLLHKDYTPAENATVVERLELGGAVILGKLAMTEGAYTSHHPNNPGPLNPFGAEFWVGSSSTGSGVATAAGLCYASLGSDTGGSIRFPCATSGLTGIKPTWGRVSRHGIFPLAASLDHVGPMARSAADAAAVLGLIAGADPKDPTAAPVPVDDYLAEIGRSIRGVTIGIDRRFVTDESDAEVLAALGSTETTLRSLGAEIRGIDFPATAELVRGWIAFCSVETAIAHKDTYPTRKDIYGPALAQLIDEGLTTSGQAIGETYHRRLAFSGALAKLFREVDLVLVPAMPVPVPTLDRMAEYGRDPEALLRILRFTAPFNFSGSPTITLPVGFDRNGLPIAMQLVGRHFAEALLCRAAHAFQQATDWHTRRPPSAVN